MKLVITGGPCAGKSSALQRLPQDLAKMGLPCFVLPETATELLHAGMHPAKIGVVPFQRTLLHLQLERERIYSEMASSLTPKPILLCDRGIIDGKAYMQNEDFTTILSEIGLTEDDVLSSYDAVFYMESTALQFPKAYNNANNNTRMETVQEAVFVDRSLYQVWEKHPRLVRIPGKFTFAEKYEILKQQVFDFLSEQNVIQTCTKA